MFLQLIDLAIWESDLTTIEDFAFQELGNLTMLELMDCSVSSNLTNNTLTGLSSVQEVDLSLSNIPYMEVGALAGLSKMHVS